MRHFVVTAPTTLSAAAYWALRADFELERILAGKEGRKLEVMADDVDVVDSAGNGASGARGSRAARRPISACCTLDPTVAPALGGHLRVVADRADQNAARKWFSPTLVRIA